MNSIERDTLLSAAEVLRITCLTAGYRPLRVRHQIDFKVADGKRVGLVGRIGHGKTTLFRAISALAAGKAGRSCWTV